MKAQTDDDSPNVSLRTTFGFVLVMLAAFVAGWLAVLWLLEARR
jgi:hypothetical protein